MKEKIKAIEFNIRSILRRIEQIRVPDNVDYEWLQVLNEITEKVFELSEKLEELEIMEEM